MKMIPNCHTSLNADISTALQVLEQIHATVETSNNDKLKASTKDDLHLLITTLQNPILRSIATIQGSLSELDTQLQEHPSILPADFNINEAGELELNVQRSIYDSDYQALSREFDDQRVPVAKLSSSSGEPSPPQLSNAGNNDDLSLPPITTPSYALEFQRVIEATSHGREVLTVRLYKPDGTSLGFSVVGLRTEEKGEIGIFIQEIQPNGIAGRDGRLREGDQILAIDGQPLDTNVSHQQAIAILQQARGVVELVVARPSEISETHSPSPSALSDASKTGSDMVLTSDWAQVEVIDLINDGSGLGFGIVGGKSTGVVVKTILPGGVADRDGRLQSGDHILQIGEVNLRGMGSEQVAAVLRQSGSHVRIVVARPVESGNPDYHQNLDCSAPVVPSSVLADPDELNKYFVSHGYPEINATPTHTANILDDYNLCNGSAANLTDNVHLPVALPVLTMDMIPAEGFNLPEMEKFNVELKKDIHGLGITIAGYVCEKEELSGIFIKSISEGSAADLSKNINVNDRIVEVDGKSLQGLTNHEAVDILRATGQVVNLSLERYLRGPKFEQLQLAIANSEEKPQSQNSPSIVSLPRFPILTDEESTVIDVADREESKTTIDSAVLLDAAHEAINLEALIDTNYEGPLKPNVEAALQAKWSNLLAPSCEIIVSQLSKFSDTGGLGISLEGTVDVINGKEIRPHHYIRSILPDGPIGLHTRLKPGDELLEVNGRRLLDMNHSEVVKTLKELPKNFRLVCSRNSDHVPIQVIDTAQEKSAFAARSILGGSLNNLIPATDRLVKAKSDGSLASTGTLNTESSLSKLKSRSLEPLTGLAMWSSEPQIIELVKGERGLGFSILDYQDPMNPSDTVIVIRSLVPGGVAQLDGRLIPGDRLLSVNDTILENASLDQAVQVLKGAPKGVVRIGVAKPLPIADSLSNNQSYVPNEKHSEASLRGRLVDTDCSTSGSTINDEHSMYSCTDSLPQSPVNDAIDDNINQGVVESLKDEIVSEEVIEVAEDSNTDEPETKEEEDKAEEDEETEEEVFSIEENIRLLPLPTALEREIKLHKGCKSLGVNVECVGDGTNGVVITETTPGGAFDCDGRIAVGDFLLSINNESLRRCTQSQARSILKRTQLLSTDILVIFITGKDALSYWTSLKRSHITPLPPPYISSQISPSSPYINLSADCRTRTVSASETTSGESVFSATKKKSLSVDSDNFAQSKQLFKSDNCVLASRSCDSDYGDTGLPVQKNATDSPLPSSGSVVDLKENSVTSDSLTVQSEENIFNVCRQYSLSENSLNASKCSSSRDIYSSHESDSTEFVRLRDNVSQFEGSSKSESDVSSTHRISLPEDELLKEDIRELGRLSKLHRLGSVDFESYRGVGGKNEISSSGEKLKTLHRFASTGVELGNDETADMILEKNQDSSSLLSKHWGPERRVKLQRDASGSLGISIVGGKVDLYNSSEESRCAISGIFIKNVMPECSAGKTGELKTGDRILEVNGIDLRTASHEAAVQTIKASTSPVTFVVQSLLQWGTGNHHEFENNSSEKPPQVFAAGNKMSSQNTKPAAIKKQEACTAEDDEIHHEVAALPSDNDANRVVEQATEKHIRTRAGRLIMRNSAGSLKRHEYDSIDESETEEDEFGYTLNKVKKKYGHLGNEVLLVELEKGSSGLGLSLAGHKDRTKMAVFVCGINPNGAAYKKGTVMVGDEILEVNGHVVHGRCHLNASAIIKGLPGPIFKLIIFRRNSEGVHDELAIKPLTQFPVSLKEESPEEKYANFKGVRIISMKKGYHGLGIMIVEGKHAEVGHGIFISDIQEGSVADQAGLMVGDMILSVNKDSLIGSSYEPAAQLLKQTEGIITLVICNPKRDTSKEAEKKMAEAVPEEPPGDPATAPIKPGRECTIEINKEKMGLGLSIVGGCDTLLGVIIIHEVYPDGAAAKDGRLKPGDQILEVNSEDFRSIPHNKALATLRQTPSKITMVVYRDESVANVNGSAREEDLLDVIDVELTKKQGKGLGLSIVGRKNGNGVFISDIVPGGAAAVDGRLMKGDQILSVMGQDLRKATQEEAAAVLKLSSGKVAIKLGRLKARPSPATSDNDSVTQETPPTYRNVTIKRGSDGFGFSIVGGHGSSQGDLPIYIKTVFEDSCKAVLKRGDQILAVDGVRLEGLTHQQTVLILKNAGDVATLTILSSL